MPRTTRNSEGAASPRACVVLQLAFMCHLFRKRDTSRRTRDESTYFIPGTTNRYNLVRNHATRPRCSNYSNLKAKLLLVRDTCNRYCAKEIVVPQIAHPNLSPWSYEKQYATLQ